MEWTIFKTFDSRSMADMLAELFRSNDVPTKIDYGIYGSGLDGVYLYVPSNLVHRAKWLTAETKFSDEELNYLATGELSSGNEE